MHPCRGHHGSYGYLLRGAPPSSPRWPSHPPTHPPVRLCSQVLAAGRVEQLAETFGIGAGLAGGGASAPRASGEAAGSQCMALDGAALENLEASAGIHAWDQLLLWGADDGAHQSVVGSMLGKLASGGASPPTDQCQPTVHCLRLPFVPIYRC